jgi:hypothetical protein
MFDHPKDENMELLRILKTGMTHSFLVFFLCPHLNNEQLLIQEGSNTQVFCPRIRSTTTTTTGGGARKGTGT